ncbi:hypothetical protein [Candidatus Lokiarchaeum ossiferum]
MADSRIENNKKDYARKEITISVRFEGQDADVINECTELFGISRSELIRKAASSYIDLRVSNPKYPNPKLFFSHNMMLILMETAPDETLKKLAKQSYENGIRDYEFFQLLGRNHSLEVLPEPDPEDEVRSLVQNVFSERGQNWFQKVHFSQKKDTIIIAGRHIMGERFSVFIRFLLEYYMEDINYHYESGMIRNSKSNRKTSTLRFIYKRNEV